MAISRRPVIAKPVAPKKPAPKQVTIMPVKPKAPVKNGLMKYPNKKMM